jgi:hypothetical protein
VPAPLVYKNLSDEYGLATDDIAWEDAVFYQRGLQRLHAAERQYSKSRFLRKRAPDTSQPFSNIG